MGMEVCHFRKVHFLATVMGVTLGWYCVYHNGVGSNGANFNLLDFCLQQGVLYSLDTEDIAGDVLILPFSGCG
jgi:hypothetical protein